MSEPSSPNLLVYRDGKQRVSANARLRQLEAALINLPFYCSTESLLGPLLRAGELECALSDAESRDADLAAAITDRLAGLACRADREIPDSSSCIPECLRLLSRIANHGELKVSRPEGFAYYALHPLDFADAVSSHRLDALSALVIGIRSIGTTLSAVTAAKLRLMDIPSWRTTVRPSGHPYDRQTKFTAAQCQLIRQALSENAILLVCDEGPGCSGSSLLSVAEALVDEGVRHEHIVLLCSHQPDINTLCAPRAAERWRRYRCIATGLTTRLPAEANHYIGGSEWRNVFLPQASSGPATWPQMERLKFLSCDGFRLFKFEGHGPYGEQARQREEILSASGFSGAYFGQESGFGIHEVAIATHPGRPDISSPLLRHFARYCAWRANAFPATVSGGDLCQLEHMARTNLEQELGFAPELHLELKHPVICDGRMQPYKWLAIGENHWVKLDASTHGDDHFFPGPTDIAWDLAGLCVEWKLNPESRNFLIAEYTRMSGDNPAPRLLDYELAYAAFRLGWTRMAAASVAGSPDEHLLSQEASRYRNALTCIVHLAPAPG